MTLIAADPDEIAAELDRRRVQRELDLRAKLTNAEYARDPLSWINDRAWIASKFDDGGSRVRVRPLKMTLWPDQEATVVEWVDLERLRETGEIEFANVLIEKSRQIGETWTLAATIAWLLEYHRVRGLFMHTRAGEVADRGWTIDSFFGRIKFVADRLEGRRDWLFRPFSSDPAAIENPSTGGIIRGECQRNDPGRGSTFDFAIVDEAAHVTHGELVHSAIDDACVSGKLYLSTPQGDDNFHARLCDERPLGWSYLRLHWSTHPIYGEGVHIAGKEESCVLCAGVREGLAWSPREPLAHRYPGKLTSPWYDSAIIGKTDEGVAAELDIDRVGALGARVFPEFEEALHVVRNGIAYDPNLPLELAWDFGLDSTPIVVIQDAPTEVRVLGLLEMGDLFGNSATPDSVVAELRAYLAMLGVENAQTDDEAVALIRSTGDPAGQARSLESGRPYVDQYRRRGFPIRQPDSRLTRRVDFSLTSVKLLMTGTPKDLRICGVNAAVFAARLRNNVWPMDAVGQRRLGSTTPLDNIHNHACRAFAYWAVDKYPPAGVARPGRTSSPAAVRIPRPRSLPAVGFGR